MSIPVKQMRKFVKRMYNIKNWTNEEILALDLDKIELTDFFDLALSTLEGHLRERKLKIPQKLNLNKEYVRRQIEYLYARRLMTIPDMQIRYNLGYYTIKDIITKAKIRGLEQLDVEKCNALTTDESVIRNFDSYRDAANVFPKKDGYKCAVY